MKRTRLLAWILFALVLLAAPGASTWAQGPDQVAIVVQFAADNVATYCVALDAPQITGLQALQRTGLDVAYLGGALGAQVCKIGPVGCDLPGACFCQCKGQECLYWSYWHLVDGAWQYAIVGAASYEVTPGSVEGWSWGIGTPNRAPQPPLISFEEVCAAPTTAPSPTATPAPTHTPSPAPTARPTHTVAATSAVAPTVSVDATATAVQSAVSTPTQAPATASAASPTPTQPAPTQTPSPLPPQATEGSPYGRASVPAPAQPVSLNYLFFGAIALVLLALGAYVLLRRR